MAHPLLRIIDQLDPQREPGRLTLITRMWAGTIREALPPLLRAYLRLGATVCGDPAVDEIFDVGDFVTIIDREHANTRYLDRLRATGARLAVSPRE